MVSSDISYPHSGMQRSGDLIILLQPRAASQDLWQPELPDCTFHVPNLALRWCWRLHPLRWLSSHTAHHVGMGQCLGGTLSWLWSVHGAWHWLSDSGMERRRPIRNDQVLVVCPTRRTRLSRPWPRGERRRHVGALGGCEGVGKAIGYRVTTLVREALPPIARR